MQDRIIQFHAGVTDCFIIQGERSNILIDTGINFTRERYLEVFAQHQIKASGISLIIVTHGHSDHFAHLSVVKELTGASIVCHKDATSPIMTGKSAPVIAGNWVGSIMKQIFKGRLTDYVPVPPDIVVDEVYDLSAHGIQGKIIHTPGHTDCSVSVLLDSGDAFTGDMFMANPFKANQPLPAVFIVNRSQLLDSMQKILDHGAQTIYGSHGGCFSRHDIERLVKRFYEKYGHKEENLCEN
jgi:hydroxyacylglutathione hydrolase